MKTFKIVGNDISDGYHTFDELYEHRCSLWVLLCLQNKDKCYWMPHYDGWFLLVMETTHGQISYHVPNGMFHFVENKIRQNDNHQWDGHTSQDVIKRLHLLLIPSLNRSDK